jgi:hypothetical protein
MERWARDVVDRIVLPDAPGPEEVLYAFYAHTAWSQASGQAALGRIFQRRAGCDA